MFKFLRGLCYFVFGAVIVLTFLFKVNIPHSRTILGVSVVLGVVFGFFVKNSKGGGRGSSNDRDGGDVDYDGDNDIDID